MLKAKEVELFMQNKELYGEKQHLSQQEYIRGISECNFDLEDLKNQATLIQDYDEISNTEEPNANSKQQNRPNDVGLPAERVSPDISDHSDNGSHHELYKRLDGAWTETKATSEKVKETLGIGKPESTVSSSSSANESSGTKDDEQSTDKEDKKQESGYASCTPSTTSTKVLIVSFINVVTNTAALITHLSDEEDEYDDGILIEVEDIM
ncbi:hypothetical protein L2E82_33519 [Cichorium intybus]|uniref:Uncharacterized protein n=1 Tax=Cichorium intybus TaxID=13427 RepID=A0ACB9BKD7_CICIN|nr:hypothetical protein L2E82_33519 [Cichorium intybus]